VNQRPSVTNFPSRTELDAMAKLIVPVLPHEILGLHSVLDKKIRDAMRISPSELSEELRSMLEIVDELDRTFKVNYRDSNFVNQPIHSLLQSVDDKLRPRYIKIESQANKFLKAWSHHPELSVSLEAIRYQAVKTRLYVASLVKFTDDKWDGQSVTRINLDTLIHRILVQYVYDKEELRNSLMVLNKLGTYHLQESAAYLIFRNLISNAWRYRKKNTETRITIFQGDFSTRKEWPVELTPIPCQDGFTDIHVLDNGIGIDELYLSKIFRPYHRGPFEEATLSDWINPDSATDTGLGIGLSASRVAALRLGGDLLVTSKLGIGSDFIVRLPSTQLDNVPLTNQ